MHSFSEIIILKPLVFSRHLFILVLLIVFLKLIIQGFITTLNGFSRSAFFESMLIYGTLEYDVMTRGIIREATWSNIIRSCSTFTARDCNAEFSEIFSSEIFRSITDDEKNTFQIIFNAAGYCANCNISVDQETNIVTVLYSLEFSDLLTLPYYWPRFLNIEFQKFVISCSLCGSNNLDGNLA